MKKLVILLSLLSSISFARSITGYWRVLDCTYPLYKQAIEVAKSNGGHLELVVANGAATLYNVSSQNEYQVFGEFGRYVYDPNQSLLVFETEGLREYYRVEFGRGNQIRLSDLYDSTAYCLFKKK